MGDYWAVMGGSRICDSDRADQSGSDDANVVDWTKTGDIILAISVHSEGKDPIANTFKLKWRDVSDEGVFADVASTGEVNYTAVTVLENGTAVAVGDRRCTTQGYTWEDGEEVEGASLTDSIDIGDGYETEVHFALDVSGADDGNQYEFELIDATRDVSLGTVGAQLTIETAAVPINVTATLDELILTEYNADVNIDVAVTATLDELVLTEYNPTVNKEISLTAILDELILTEHNPTVNKEISLTAGVDALILTEYNADVNIDVAITAALDALVLTEYNATVDLGGVPINVTAILDELVLTEYNPTVNKEVNISAGIDTLILTEHSATVNKEVSFTASYDILTLLAYNATVDVGATARKSWMKKNRNEIIQIMKGDSLWH